MAYLDMAGLGTLWAGLKEKLVLKTSVANNLTTTAAGSVLDARQGKVLNDAVAQNATNIGKGASPYTHAKTGTTHSFTGAGRLGFAVLTADWADGDTFTVNGTAVETVGDMETLCSGASALFSVEDGTLYLYGVADPFVIPDGATAVPVNSVETWIECTGVTYESAGSPTLTQIVANQSLCATLMNSQNAVNYMIRSTTLQTAVLGSTTATAALDASTPYISTMQIQEDGGAVYGTPFDLLLTLTDPVWPYRVKYSARSNDPANGLPSLVQGSVDNVNWINVTNEVSQTGYTGWDENGIITYTPLAVSSAFKYYRVRILSGGNVQKYIKFQLYGKVEG